MNKSIPLSIFCTTYPTQELRGAWRLFQTMAAKPLRLTVAQLHTHTVHPFTEQGQFRNTPMVH